MSGKLIVVVGGQFGSEAKGHVVGYLTRREAMWSDVMVMRVAGSNAGHTVYDDDGNKLQLRHVPVGVVVPEATLTLAPGSEIDRDVLNAEVDWLESLGHKVRGRLFIDSQATLMESEYEQSETGLAETIGSTGKGIGAARAARALRRAKLVEIGENVTYKAIRHMHGGGTVIIEGTQGFGLGSHAGYYPNCTSSDCRAIDFLAMAGLSPWGEYVRQLEVWVVYRTHPIRIAGPSGPLEGETTWEQLGLAPEVTTVTKKTRRVGKWNAALALQAYRANGGPSPAVKTALMFADYLHPEIAGERVWAKLKRHHHETLDRLATSAGLPVWGIVGTGPNSLIYRGA